jgi:hypothetical protein
VDQLPDPRFLPIAQPPPAGHAGATPELLRISQGMPLRNTNAMPTKQVLSGRRGLPALGLGLETGMNGSISPHNLSGKSSDAI